MQQVQTSLDEWRYQQRRRDAARYSCSLQQDFPVDLLKPSLAAEACITNLSVREEVSNPEQLSFDKFRRRLEEFDREEYSPSPLKKQKVVFEKVDHVREQVKINQDIFKRLKSELRGNTDGRRSRKTVASITRMKAPIVEKHTRFESRKKDKKHDIACENEAKQEDHSSKHGHKIETNGEFLSTIRHDSYSDVSMSAKFREEEIAELVEKLRTQQLFRTNKVDNLYYDDLAKREANTILEIVLLEEMYDLAQDVFDTEEEKSRSKQLPPELEEVVDNALHGGSLDEVLISKFNVDITRRHLQCLLPTTWLNDEVINFYFQLISDRDKALVKAGALAKPSHFFNSFFYSKVAENGYNYINVRRWTRKIDIFAMDKIFVPVNVGNVHWCLAVVYMSEKRIQYYDSMHGSGSICLKVLLRYLNDESLHKKKQKFDDAGWELVSTTLDTPQQNNGSDCGVFSCIFADYLSLNKSLSFKQRDIPFHRHRMVLHCCRGYLPLEEEGL